jgi:hypothetical protein
MTVASGPEPLEVFPIPEGAIELRGWDEAASSRELSVAALQQAMAERRLALPLGPELDLANPQRLLMLNRFAVQLATAGLLADEVAVDQGVWRDATSAPQLLLAALVDEENGVVQLQGVLTGAELEQHLAAAGEQEGRWLLNVELFRGGVDRLFTLVQLLEPEALPRLALAALPESYARVVAVADWLQGRVDEVLELLGGVLMPPSAELGFRSAAAPADLEAGTPMAVLSIPLGLTPDGVLVTGEQARQCVETFQLLLIPSCSKPDGGSPEALILQLIGTLAGDLLPDGIELIAEQGRLRQSASSEQSTEVSLCFRGEGPIQVSLRSGSGEPVQLPPLQLPQA